MRPGWTLVSYEQAFVFGVCRNLPRSPETDCEAREWCHLGMLIGLAFLGTGQVRARLLVFVTCTRRESCCTRKQIHVQVALESAGVTL